MTVTKVVVLVLRIPEHFSLHLYDFSTILYGIYKFAAFDSSVHVSFSLRPLDFCFFSGKVPGGLNRTEQGRAQRFPAMGLAGGEGKVGEKGEGFTPHLMVVLARREVDGGGGSAERGGRRWLCSPASMLR